MCYRVYICVCVDDLHILSPSTTMSSLIRERENEREMERPMKRKRKEEGRKDEGKSVLYHNQPERIIATAERREEERKEGEEGDGGMEVDKCIAGPSQTSRRRETEGTSVESCVSLLFQVHSKQGVAFRNVQSTNEAHALILSFVIKATRLGDIQVWDRDPKNRSVEERETKGAEITVPLYLLLFAVIIVVVVCY